MKKLVIFILSLNLLLGVTGCNVQQRPYQEIISEINEENGWTITIVDEEAFYNTYKDMSRSEIKKDIVERYREILENDSQSPNPDSNSSEYIEILRNF